MQEGSWLCVSIKLYFPKPRREAELFLELLSTVSGTDHNVVII